MTKSSVIKLPDGTTIEVSPDTSPEQITAMISALTNSQSLDSNKGDTESPKGEVYIHQRSLEEIWEGSKKERVALFIRSYMAEDLWFGAKDLMDQQLAVANKIILGETSAIGTYLTRLFESGYLDKKKSKNGRSVYYRMTDLLVDEYPAISSEKIKLLVQNRI